MMNDFKSGLLLRSVENKAWWTKYSMLNTISPPPQDNEEYWRK